MFAKIIVCVLALSTGHSVNIPSSLKKCHRTDANFNSCLASAIENYFSKSANPVKEINLIALEPLSIPHLVISEGSGPVAFQQNYQNISIRGFTKSKCSKADLNFEARTLYLECESALVRMDFEYEINGKLFLFPMTGKGPGFVEFDNFQSQATFSLDEFEKKGKKHYKVTDCKLVLETQGMRIHLENLFDGDKTLGNAMNHVLNENWKEVSEDVKSYYEEAYGKIFAAIFNNVLNKVSVDELFGKD